MKFPRLFPPIPEHREPREWRSTMALIASILGSVALTFFSGILVYILWKGGWANDTAPVRVEVLGKALMLSLAGSLVVLITLGFAINRRMIRFNKDGFEASGGDGEQLVSTAVSVAAPPVDQTAPTTEN